MSKSTLKSNRQEIKSQLAQNLPNALAAMGDVAVNLITAQMETGYSKPIRDTGALIADVSSQVNGDAVEVGNTLPYAGFVHDGTYKMEARHYINDALLNESAKAKLGEAAKAELFR